MEELLIKYKGLQVISGKGKTLVSSLSHSPAVPRVSIIIPTYNCAGYISQALDSIFSQSYPYHEVIVVDDGSTDDTVSVLESYHDRIRYFFQNNQGVCAARNHGIKESRGEFIVFLDADDYFLPNKLAEQVAAFDTIPSPGIVHSGWSLVNEKAETIRDIEPWHNTPVLDLHAWLLWKPVFFGAMMFRRKHLERIRGFDTRLRQAEDVDLVFRLALMGCKAVWLRKTTVCYRLHGGNTIQDGLQQAKDLLFVIDNFFANPVVPNKIRRAERRIRYHTSMWVVWQLYRTGYKDHISEHLQQAQKWSVYYPGIMFVVLDWAVQLARHCIRDGCDIAELSAFWPYFKDAAQLGNDIWVETENSLNWWLNVWWCYLHHDCLKAIMGLLAYRELNVHEIIRRAIPVIFVNPDTTVEMLSQFWQDARENGSVSLSDHHEVTALYLAVFAESVFGLHLMKGLNAFYHAVRAGFHPKAWRIWFQFLKTALGYFYRNLTKIAFGFLSKLRGERI